MPLTRALAAIGAAAALAIGLSLAITASADEPEPAVRVASVVWDERPESAAEMASEASVVVEAEVGAITAGPPLEDDAQGDPGEHSVPTQRITFTAVDVLDGQIASTFELFKTGSPELHLEGDPLYAVGETYLLFLVPFEGEPGTWIPVAPDGRLELDSRGEAQPVIEGPVASELEGLTPSAIAAELP